MKRLTSHIRNFFASKVLSTAYSIIKRRYLIGPLLIAITSLTILLLADSADTGTQDQPTRFLYLSLLTWKAVAASGFAAAIFTYLQHITTLLNAANEESSEAKYRQFLESGMLEIYTQRGSDEINNLFSTLINSARYRVWAFGMTNRKLVAAHLPELLSFAETFPEATVAICYWDPKARIYKTDKDNTTLFKDSLASIQTLLEDRTSTPSDTEQNMVELQLDLIKRLSTTTFRAKVQIVNLAIPTNVSALVIDDDLFIFPFLAGIYSSSTPIMRFSTTQGAGKSFGTHFELLLNADFTARYREVVFDSSGSTQH